jgi:hypothetical protein
MAVVTAQELVVALSYITAQCIARANVELSLLVSDVHEDDVVNRARCVSMHVRYLPCALGGDLNLRFVPAHFDIRGPTYESRLVAT